MRIWGDAGRRRARVGTLAVCAGALLAPASASAGWDPAEPIAQSASISHVFAAPGGPGYAIGYPLTMPSRFRIVPRPFGGTLGVPMELPSTAGTNFDGDIEFDAAGNALIANTYMATVTYRDAAGGGSATQQMPPGLYPTRISVAPSGDAMVGINTSPSGPVKVAFRAAGPGATVDLAGAETFSANGVLVGLQLQADGGAIVVWQEGDTLKQSIRQAGNASFDTPTVINDPRPDVRKFLVVFDADPSGHALLSWSGSSGGTARDQAVATVRAPGGSFGAAQIIGGGGRIVNVFPAMTASGDGIVSWRHDFTEGACPGVTVMGSAVHAGAFAAQAPLGPSAFPTVSIPAGQPLAGTTDVAVAMIEIEDAGAPPGTPCNFGDDRRGLFVHHFRATASGLVDQGISELSPLATQAGGATSYPLTNDLTMEPGGKILVSYQVDAARYLRSFDGVPPGAGGGSPPPVAPVPAPAPAPVATPKPSIVPIVARKFVVLAPIDPKLLSVSMGCTIGDVQEGDCSAKLAVYYAFTRKPKETAGKSAKTKVTLVKIATAAATIKAGTRKKVKLKLTRDGKALIARGKKVKVFLDVTITRGGRTNRERLSTTLKARKR